jgi:hypothetical protein
MSQPIGVQWLSHQQEDRNKRRQTSHREYGSNESAPQQINSRVSAKTRKPSLQESTISAKFREFEMLAENKRIDEAYQEQINQPVFKASNISPIKQSES